MLGDLLASLIPGTSSIAQHVGFTLFANLLYVYGTAVAMRATGLYYHHFKKWFAWSWG